MRLLFVFCLIVAISHAACTIDYVVQCAMNHVDTNNDTFIDIQEINTFIAENPCNARTIRTSGTKVIDMCDRNSDSQLDSVDAHHANSCLNNPGVLALACSICDACQ